MAKRKLKLEGIADSNLLCGILNNQDDTEVAETALSVPILKKRFKEHLIDCGITEGLSEATIEAGFMDWLLDVLDGVEITITLNIDHLYEE